MTTATVESICQALAETTSLFAVFDWAEEEIEKAQHRHGETGRGPIWRAGFTLVRPTLDRTYTCEMLYRSHAAELLDRFARGEDTRPATTAEMIAALLETALKAPLAPSAFCLYMRLFIRAFPQTALSLFGDTDALDPAAYESVHGARADEHEAELRRALTRSARTPKTAGTGTLPEGGCGGGEQLC
ncbi:hypothetical protein [Streptacidiphilus anmyonensis]|uniref:hypothetical protein n=1 Tax=Streptacidiphilus anmyonensis TaxID=405782 RepID=UPI0005A9B488|nr:hypothetical protein [Streptacidiphilus anmyonensis]